jgi:hypothetical protein
MFTAPTGRSIARRGSRATRCIQYAASGRAALKQVRPEADLSRMPRQCARATARSGVELAYIDGYVGADAAEAWAVSDAGLTDHGSAGKRACPARDQTGRAPAGRNAPGPSPRRVPPQRLRAYLYWWIELRSRGSYSFEWRHKQQVGDAPLKTVLAAARLWDFEWEIAMLEQLELLVGGSGGLSDDLFRRAAHGVATKVIDEEAFPRVLL